MNRRVSRLQSHVRSSRRQVFALGVLIQLVALGVAIAQDQAAPPEQPAVTTPPVATPPETPPPPAAPEAPAPAKTEVAQAEQPVKLKPTVVTGSLIPTAETVGPAPVETVTAADIAKTGSQDVLALVKRLSTTFFGAGNVGQTLNNGGAGEGYAQIHNLRSLILLNGHRLGNSALSATVNIGPQYVDLNTIPVAAIDRIEVLKDGSSAIYGSEAVGGVINIILKKDFTGVELGGRYGAATGKGSFTEQRASVVTGVTTDDSSYMAGAQYYHEDPLLAKDRSIASASLPVRHSKGLGAPTYFSNSYPGRVEDDDGVWILANSPFAKGSLGYNPNLIGGPTGATAGSPPIVPGGGTFTSVAAYNAAAIGSGITSTFGNKQS